MKNFPTLEKKPAWRPKPRLFGTSIFAMALAIGSLGGAPLLAEDETGTWPAFRGPDANPVVNDDPRLPLTWGETENVLWKVDVAGMGWSSPVVWGKKIFLTSVTTDGEVEEPKKGLYYGGNRLEPPAGTYHWWIMSFDLETGKELWRKEVHAGVAKSAKHLKNTFASETPAVDADHVYALFGNLGLWALTHDGEVSWHHELEPRETAFGWGTAASPVLAEGKVFIVNDNLESSYVAAYDAKSGALAWQVDRPDEKSNWATPYVWKNEKGTELVTAGTVVVRSYSLDGELLWWFRGMSTIAIPQPFAVGNLLYVTSGYVGDSHRPVYAIRPGVRGDIQLGKDETQNEAIAWYLPQAGPYNPTPLIYRGIYYTLLDRGFLTAHNAADGSEVFGKQRFDTSSTAFTVSPWAYNGHLFALSEDCRGFAVKAGSEFEVVATSQLDDMCMASPAIVDGTLVLRTRSHLYRLGLNPSREGAEAAAARQEAN